jgi:hypothetical protein
MASGWVNAHVPLESNRIPLPELKSFQIPLAGETIKMENVHQRMDSIL